MAKSAMRDRIKYWAEQCYAGEPVIVLVTYAQFKGERGAYQECRRIVTGFASLRTWERKRVDARQLLKEEAPLALTPYEDVICRIVHWPERRLYEVHFTEATEEMWDEMYPQIQGVYAKPKEIAE